MRGAVILSTKMAVPALVCYELPIEIPGFQKAFPFLEFNSLCQVGNAKLIKVVLLKKEDLWWGLEGSNPSFDEFLFGRVPSQPSHIERGDRHGPFKHGEVSLGRWSDRLIPNSGPVRALRFAGCCFPLPR